MTEYHPEWGEIDPKLWKCRYLKCAHGMGLAGKYSCPGSREHYEARGNCPYFKQREYYEDEVDDTQGE